MTSKADKEERVLQVVKHSFNHPTLSVRESLKLAGFSHERSADRALQMRVRRRPEAKARAVAKVK